MSKITVAFPVLPYASTLTGGTRAGGVKGEIDDMTGHVALSWPQVIVFCAPSEDPSDRDASKRCPRSVLCSSPPGIVAAPLAGDSWAPTIANTREIRTSMVLTARLTVVRVMCAVEP